MTEAPQGMVIVETMIVMEMDREASIVSLFPLFCWPIKPGIPVVPVVPIIPGLPGGSGEVEGGHNVEDDPSGSFSNQFSATSTWTSLSGTY